MKRERECVDMGTVQEEILGRGTSECKSFKTRAWLGSWRKSKEAVVTGVKGVRGRGERRWGSERAARPSNLRSQGRKEAGSSLLLHGSGKRARERKGVAQGYDPGRGRTETRNGSLQAWPLALPMTPRLKWNHNNKKLQHVRLTEHALHSGLC